MKISELQKDLAAVFRWTAKLNMHEGIANHFSVCMPDSNDFYVNGTGMHFSNIKASDLVLIPMAASHVDFWATGAIVEIAKKANKKILIQINRANQRSKLISKTNDFIKSLNLSATKTIIGNRQIFASSMGEGKTAVEKQKKSNAVEEIKNLSEQILLEIK